MSESTADFSIQLANYQINQSIDRIDKRDPPPCDYYTFFIGPDGSKFTISTQVFNLYAPEFHEETSAWPHLSPYATKLTFEFCSSRYLGFMKNYDVETLRSCFDIYNCADSWGIQSLKTYVCQVICGSNILARVEDYGAFLAQLYQLNSRFAGSNRGVSDALTKCLRTITKEHSLNTGATKGKLSSRLYKPLTRERELKDLLLTEYNRLGKDCWCKFCKYQRANYQGGNKGPFWALRIAKADLLHDSKAIWSTGLAPIKAIFGVLFNAWMIVVFGWLFMTLGSAEFVREAIQGTAIVLAYLLLLVVIQFGLLVIIAANFLFDQSKPLFKTPVKLLKWVAWRVVFPRSMGTHLGNIVLAVYFILLSLGFILLSKGLVDYREGNGPFDRLTTIVMRDNPWLVLERVGHHSLGIASPSSKGSWVNQYAKYMEKIEKAGMFR
ncbi:hypothetical protein TWF718_003381 [Orbilia javanica]|uniref:Uncharacterized protein n=1 Tax=Orbilia javanica TaxID=47235 RepID=A0AAN8R8Z8_9PEZI